MKAHVSKYDNLDELNMLALYMSGMEDYELDKLQAILTSGATERRTHTSLASIIYWMFRMK